MSRRDPWDRGRDRARILLGGMFSRVPDQGGLAWVVLQYVLGLRDLGHDVLLVEPLREMDLRPAGARLAESENADYFQSVVRQFGLEDQAALLVEGTGETFGLSYGELREAAHEADLLINLAGGLNEPDLLEQVPVRLYVDLDPGFTQLWNDVEGIDMRFEGHTHFATVGLTLGHAGSSVPTCGIEWIPTPPPVVLAEWPFARRLERDSLTTVANWRGYGSIQVNGTFYGQKAHSLRRLLELPRRTGVRFELALAIDPGEPRDLAALAENGWELVDPGVVAATPEAYRRFVQGSRGEFGIAKSGYVEGRCGWFSDRSVCYLASGRPVIAQETGFSGTLPTGEGLLVFEGADDVAGAVDALASDYERHRQAARTIAEEIFASEVVLPRLLSRVGIDA
jgi:hypothetical protein